MRLQRSLFILLIFVGFHSPLAKAVLVNGSFEDPTTSGGVTINGPANTTGLPGWTVSLSGIDLVNALGNGFISGAAADGSQYIDLDGSPGPGQISQSFATTPGQSYLLIFAYSNNPVGAQSSNPGVAVAVAGSDFAPITLNHSTGTQAVRDWTPYSGSFLALGLSATLQFTSTSTGGFGGILLDAVEVSAVPELSSCMLVGAVGMAIAAACRRQKRQIRS